jgi:hypothetical protein
MVVGEMPKNEDKPLKNQVKSQAAANNDSWRNVGEWKLPAKHQLNGQVALCQGLPVN